jgi:DNA repair exonuclease SbcCD ATPase subunit
MEHVEIDETDGNEALELSDDDRETSEEIDADQQVDYIDEDDEWSHYADAEVVSTSKAQLVAPILLGLSIALWTGFFAWANRDIFTTIPTMKGGIDLLSQYCLPIATFAILYLLYMRNSTREAKRFNDVASSLRAESEQLEYRLKTVNNELAMAREFLAGETRELETLGSQSSDKLNQAASNIKTALSDGLSKMKKLDDVGGAAFKNLEQLREHLPVVINTAKDVTNQIGNSGRSAQAEIAAMVTTLKRVGDVGTAAKKSLDELTQRSEVSLENLATTAKDIETKFSEQLAEAETGSNKIASVLKKASAEVITALHETRAELATETSESSQAIKSDLAALEETLSNVGKAADDEEARLKALVAELNQNIVDISTQVETLDNESGEKTAKLAFAMTALEQNSAALKKSIEEGHGTADGMIERIEQLLVALDSSARELDETLPAAFDRMNAKTEDSLSTFQRMSEEAAKVGTVAEEVTAKIEKSDEAIEEQRAKLAKLSQDGTVATDNVFGRIEKLAGELRNVREQNEALAESAGEKLISALLRVKETARQASEHSREALENSISGSAEAFEKVSEEALNKIIDEKISSIAPKLETAVSKAVATTESTAGHLTSQLNAIEEMTVKLEQRILFAKEKAEQSSEENFTRRVALLTESLNSTAIDVSKLFSNEVTDTEWAAYLKGDRGIFTRRAVRLLDASEVREILSEYDNNSEFREHVNRYIHDFETMLRGVLATRDGSAVSVTLLSSDIGKLYVALAQAIERLRN